MPTSHVCPTCAAIVDERHAVDGLCPACLLGLAIGSTDGHRPAERDNAVLARGTAIGPFRVVRLVGEGGMAAVYEAHEPALDRSVALKILPREFLHDGTFAERFQREARVVAALEHPNIVPIYATGIDDGIPWMSMRLLQGGTLTRALARRLSIDETMRVLRGVASALDYAHARGVIHRDIKPSNILLDVDDHVCVTDFGVARLLATGSENTVTGAIVGTAQYMSPEQALGHPLDRRSDLYSLAVVAYEMLIENVPFDGPSLIAIMTKHVNDPVPIPPGIVSQASSRVLLKALDKNPAKRWSTAAAFVDALESSFSVHPSPMRWRSVTAASVGVAATFWVIQTFAPDSQQSSSRTNLVGTTSHLTTPLVPGVAMVRPEIATDRNKPIPPPLVRNPSRDPLLGGLPSTPNPGNDAGPPGEPTESATRLSEVAEPKPSPSVAAEPSAPAATQPVVEADLFTPPILKEKPDPSYPALAIAAQLEGDVLLEAHVSETGDVTEVKVLRSVHLVLDDAARRAVLKYRYTPAQRNGQPVATTIVVSVSFRLKELELAHPSLADLQEPSRDVWTRSSTPGGGHSYCVDSTERIGIRLSPGR